ncbi:hypothetical protein B7R21_04770 [Subtercola boreus]|uniref:Type I restriction modification DNA specificity domain-containing protein n=2 Tax=Subtercola boreus TaxID=120213 RepID=A0A3E0W010_9MICO|nr:hypothetical protein B7R21_04770 [Subtercola boreus]
MLGQFVSLQRGQSYHSALLGLPGPMLLGLGTIERNGGFKGSKLKTYGGETSDKILLTPGDLYVSLKDVTHSADLLGAVARVPAEVPLGRLTQDTIRLNIENDSVDSAFLYYTLHAPAYRAYCRVHSTGTTNLDLSQKDFLSYRFWVPGRSEQRAIAEVLGALDDKIAANTKLATTIEELVGAVFVSLEPSTAGDVFLGDLLSFEYGKPLPAEIRVPGAVKVIGSGGAVGVHDTPIVADSGVVVGRKGTAGAVHWVDGPHWPIDTTYFVEPKGPDVSSEYAFFALRGLGLKELNSDSAVPGLNRNEAMAIRRPFHSGLVRRKFTETARPMITLSSQISRESQQLAELRDTLLPQLMSGALRVRDAETIVSEAV